MPSPLQQLDEAREEILPAKGADFLRRLREYVRLLRSDGPIKAAVDELRQEIIDADAQLTQEDTEFVAKLVPIRQRLADEEPNVDDSAEPWPGPYEPADQANARAWHDWTYTLANFDAIAEDRKEKVKIEGGDLDESRSRMLIAILNGKLHDLVFPFNERPAPRSDLMNLYDEMNEVGHAQQNAYRRVERLADETGYLSLLYLDEVGASLEPKESRPLKDPDDRREVLEEALKRPDLFRLHEVMRPAEARGTLSEEEIEAVARVEEGSRSALDRLHRPLRKRIEQREAQAAPAEQSREHRLPTLFGRINRLSPTLSLLADIGGVIALALLVYQGLRWAGVV